MERRRAAIGAATTFIFATLAGLWGNAITSGYFPGWALFICFLIVGAVLTAWTSLVDRPTTSQTSDASTGFPGKKVINIGQHVTFANTDDVHDINIHGHNISLDRRITFR